MTTVLVEAPVQTPEEERAARRDTLQRLWRTPDVTPLFQFDDLLAMEEAIHGDLVRHISPQDLAESLKTMTKEHPFLNTTVLDEPLIAKLIHIAKGEINLALRNHN